MTKRILSFALAFPVALLGSCSSLWAVSWPIATPCSLLTTYCQYHDDSVKKSLHTGLDILAPAGANARAAEPCYVQWRYVADTSQVDSVYSGVGLGNGVSLGWIYFHLSRKFVEDSLPLAKQFSALQRVGPVSGSGVSGWIPHLHFERVEGQCCDQDIFPYWWLRFWTTGNPLDSLAPESTATRSGPFFYGIGGVKIKLLRDSSELGSYPAYPWKHIGADSFRVVNRHADVISKPYYTAGPNIQCHLMPQKVTYRITGGGTQDWKGFEFTGAVDSVPRNEQVACTIYDTTWAGAVFAALIVSNVKGISHNLRVEDLDSLHGYWNTRQHKNREWNEADADSNAEAKFPDGWHWVWVKADDDSGRTAQESLKVIVNNFPPQVKQTYPDSGGVNFVSGDSIRILFDQPMSTASAESAFHLQLKGTSSDIAGTKHFAGETLLVFIPQDTLRLDTVYVVKIDATAKDIADSTMLNPYEFPFSTQRTVLLFSVREGSNQNSIQQFDSTATETLHVYQRYTGIGPTTGPMMCYDRQGNNYIVHWASVMGVNCVSKFSYSGDSLGRFLVGRKYRSITTDGDSLFLLQRSPSDTMRYQYMLKASLSGDSGSCFFMSSTKGWTAGAVWYNPWDSLLYVTWEDTSGAHNDTAFVRKYQRNGQQVGGDLWTSSIHGLRKLIVVNDRVALIRAYPGSVASQSLVTFHRLSNWNSPFYVNLTPYDPYGGVPWVFGATATPTLFYVTARSWLGGSNYGHWIARFDRNGSFLDALVPPDGYNTFCGAMAAFPPAIRFPKATYTPPDQGDDGGGGQSAELNSLLPRVYTLGQSYPNPAKGGLRIDYALPKESQVNLRIYNVAGQLVRTLREGKEKPGFYKAEWDGKDQNGHRVASGVYLYRIEAGEFRKVRKLVVVR